MGSRALICQRRKFLFPFKFKCNYIDQIIFNNFQVHQSTQFSCKNSLHFTMCKNLRTVNFRPRLQDNAALISPFQFFSLQYQLTLSYIFSLQYCSKTLARYESLYDGLNNVKYNLLAKELNAICRILSDYRSPHHDLEAALDGCSVNMSPELVEQVLKRCCNLWVPAYRFFVWAGRQPGFQHSNEGCNIMVEILGKNRQFDTIWVLLRQMKYQTLPLTHKTFTVVMKRYARAQLPQDAVETFRRMSDFGCEPVVEDFNTLLSILCENKLVSHAHEFYREVGDKFPPDVRTYNVLIRSWGEIGDAAQAQRVFQEMAKQNCVPDVAVYNSLLSSLLKGGQLEEAYQILDLMRVRGPAPNVSTCSIFVHAHCEADQVDEALKVLGRMKRYGLVPDVGTYNTLIRKFCKMNKVDDAYTLLDEMAYKGVKPDVRSYNMIQEVHCKQSQVKRALRLVQRMDNDRCKPDDHTYNMLIKMLISIGCFDRALEAWNGMEERGLYPGVTTYATLIHGFCKKRKYEEACKYFEEMIDEGIPPYPCTCELLTKCLLGAKQRLTVQILAEKMQKSTSCSIQDLSKILTEKKKSNKKFMPMGGKRKKQLKG